MGHESLVAGPHHPHCSMSTAGRRSPVWRQALSASGNPEMQIWTDSPPRSGAFDRLARPAGAIGREPRIDPRPSWIRPSLLFGTLRLLGADPDAPSGGAGDCAE